MATIFKCDRCGKEYSNRDDMFIIAYPLYRVNRGLEFNKDNVTSKDLCSVCVFVLNYWFDEPTKNG